MNMFKDKDSKGIELECNYLASSHEFEVIVKFKTTIKKETFKASFEPRFGMDVVDSNQALVIAEKLAQQIERELNI